MTLAAADGRFIGNHRATLAHVMEERLAQVPDKPWILTAERGWTYREIDRLACRYANGLVALGVRRGDTVLIMLENCIEFVALWCATSKIGAVEVPVNCHYRGRLLSYLIGDSKARLMIASAEFLPRLADVADEIGGLEVIAVRGEPTAAPAPIAGARMVPLASVPTSEETFAAVSLDASDLAAIMYTSGTTGPSKGVMVCHGHAHEYARGVIDMLEMREDDIYYGPLPLFHIAGQWAVLYTAAIAGATAVMPDTFSPSKFWPTCRRFGATATFVLGAMANLLHRQPPLPDDADNPVERILIVPLFPEVEEFKRRFDVLASTTWGGTEMNCSTRSGFDLVDARSCGRVDERLYDVRIFDENDDEVPPGVPGEAVVRPKRPWIVMAGYWGRPDWTAQAWRNQWLHTGDMMMKDKAGNLYFVDRIKDAIRRRGENISSMEVEREMNAYPAVLESAVIPVASDLTEQEVMAVVVPRPGIVIDPADLVAFLTPRMPYFMVPRYLDLVEELPKTPTGKIQKFALRERGLTSSTWDRERAGVTVRR